jgi:hypothetical protein
LFGKVLVRADIDSACLIEMLLRQHVTYCFWHNRQQFVKTPGRTGRYPGHLKENGFNALMFNQMANSWVRDVRFLNADTAVYFWGTIFSTVQDVEIDVTR